MFREAKGGLGDHHRDSEAQRLRWVDGGRFGVSVSISGDTVVVGASGADNDMGSAYVFEKPETGWVSATETAKLSASDRIVRDIFGSSVAINGGTVVVGAPGMLGEPGRPAPRPAISLVFVQPVGGWTDTTQTAKITPTDGHVLDRFGTSVAIRGDTVVVGRSGYLDYGSAYVFVQPAGGWTDATQTAKIIPTDRSSMDLFGNSVAISGDIVVVGASGADNNKGSAYVSRGPTEGWASATETARLSASDGWIGTTLKIRGHQWRHGCGGGVGRRQR